MKADPLKKKVTNNELHGAARMKKRLVILITLTVLFAVLLSSCTLHDRGDNSKGQPENVQETLQETDVQLPSVETSDTAESGDPGTEEASIEENEASKDTEGTDMDSSEKAVEDHISDSDDGTTEAGEEVFIDENGDIVLPEVP